MSKNVALVLSGGGARGMAHIGVIEILKARGYNITSIAGTSIGSLIGGLYATNHLNDYKEWVCTLDKSDIFNLMDFQLSSDGFLKGKKVFSQMGKWLDGVLIEDLSIPYVAVATDILTDKKSFLMKDC